MLFTGLLVAAPFVVSLLFSPSKQGAIFLGVFGLSALTLYWLTAEMPMGGHAAGSAETEVRDFVKQQNQPSRYKNLGSEVRW